MISPLMGVCIGDALGVPVEFKSRSDLEKTPITTMTGYGTYNQPPGTWSDDSSLTFCLAASLASKREFNLEDIASRFCRWRNAAYWTARGEVFDIGYTTHVALASLEKGVSPRESGLTKERSNGNGSLMRILPMIFLSEKMSFPCLLELVHECSGITHGHLRSKLACDIYISIALSLWQGESLIQAYQSGIKRFSLFCEQSEFNNSTELSYFERVLTGQIPKLFRQEISSSGYVVHTLEASLWCLLTTDSYSQAVLKAVNLGEDTDTTAAVTGGLAGLFYGINEIPQQWQDVIAKYQEIVELGNELSTHLNG